MIGQFTSPATIQDSLPQMQHSRNLRYWGAPRNEGFVLMPNEIEAYRLGDKAYEFKGTNGFMITVDITSNDVN
jgi:hypothetical protein